MWQWSESSSKFKTQDFPKKIYVLFSNAALICFTVLKSVSRLAVILRDNRKLRAKQHRRKYYNSQTCVDKDQPLIG